MSGHSKWATTKHKKAAIDAKRGKLFAKLIKNIEVAARNGGPDPDGNPTLFDAIQKAKKNSVPADNINREVTQKKSEIGGKQNQRDSLRSLGLKRINDVVVHEDRPEIRGMINVVRHLVTVEEVD